MDDEQHLLNCFHDATCETFSHEDHVHVAWLLLRDHDLQTAIMRFAEGARSLAQARGRPEIYHATITWAYMILVNERIHRGQSDDWRSFREHNADLLAPNKSALNRYYKPGTLDTELARKIFLLPDAMG